MEKKHGFIFLTLGLILLVYGLLKYNDLFVTKPGNEDHVITGFNYDYVKSRDTNKKTKISYLVSEKLPIVDESDEYYKYYNNTDGLSLVASVERFDGTIKTYSNNQFNAFKKNYEKDGQTVSTSVIDCKYLCYRDKVKNKDGKLLIDEIRLYIQITPSELFELNYRSDNKELSKELIENVVKTIKTTNDATYLIGNYNDEDEKLVINFNLKNDTAVIVKLDSNKYEEVVSGYNSAKATTIKDITIDAEMRLIIRYQRKNISFEKDVDTFFGSFDSKKEIIVGDKKFFEYDSKESKDYAYLLDDKALLIQTLKGTIDINDFTNIKVIDVS